jgi:hypothetical protein
MQVFLTSALVGGEWSASRHGRFTPGERAPGTHWIGGQVGPRACLNDEKRKFLTLPGRELRPVQPVASRYTDCDIPAPRYQNLILKNICNRLGHPWQCIAVLDVKFS